MSDQGDQAGDQAKFAAREFVARWYRETGENPSAVITDRMLFAYEIGYLRGRSDATRDAVQMFNEQARVACPEGEEEDDDAE